MKIVILGLSITSSWGNGHATTYRGLVKALTARGHEVLFLERDVPWYAENRDLPEPPFGRTHLYNSLSQLRDRFTSHVRDADLVVVVGGDGSVLLTVQRMRKQVPILGINWGEVGFLTDLEPGEAIDFFAGLDAFEVEQRMRVRLSAGGRVLGDALNEGLIVTDRPAKMLRFGVYVDGTLSERFRADGLLVSTPTGSTRSTASTGSGSTTARTSPSMTARRCSGARRTLPVTSPSRPMPLSSRQPGMP